MHLQEKSNKNTQKKTINCGMLAAARDTSLQTRSYILTTAWTRILKGTYVPQ
jgi:hypothetical protein